MGDANGVNWSFLLAVGLGVKEGMFDYLTVWPAKVAGLLLSDRLRQQTLQRALGEIAKFILTCPHHHLHPEHRHHYLVRKAILPGMSNIALLVLSLTMVWLCLGVDGARSAT